MSLQFLCTYIYFGKQFVLREENMKNRRREWGALALFAFLLFASQSCKHAPFFIGEEQVIPVPEDTGGGSILPGIPCDPDTAYFENQILPILLSTCAVSGCHDVTTHREGIILSTYADVLNPSDHLVIPGNASGSRIVQAINGSGEDRMPPYPYSLSSDEKQLITLWINQGALNNACSDCDTTNITFSGTISLIMNAFCTGCHDASSPAGGINLTSYGGVSAEASNGKLYGSVAHLPGYLSMPQGGASLPNCQINQIRIWVDAGFPDN